MIVGSMKHLLAARQSFAALRTTTQYTGTFVLRREKAALLSDRDHPEGSYRRLRPRHRVYDTVQRPASQPLPSIDVILTHHVDGLGRPGDVVSVKVTRAHDKLLALDRAVYASPENVLKYGQLAAEGGAGGDEAAFSSIYSAQTAAQLQRVVLVVAMNLEQAWTIQPWHVRVAFRKSGFVVPESCLRLPERQIVGPDVENLQGRDFVVTVTINSCETVPVRCRIHHHATDPRHQLYLPEAHWRHRAEPVFEEERERLEGMPLPPGAAEAEPEQQR